MILTRFIKREGRQKFIDAREASNLWEIAMSKYMILEYQQTAQHLAKDVDLKCAGAYGEDKRKNDQRSGSDHGEVPSEEPGPQPPTFSLVRQHGVIPR